MQKTFQISLRNLKRNQKRTVITITTIMVGVIASMLAKGMINGTLKAITENVTRNSTGDFQIHAKGYQEAIDIAPLHLTIEENSTLEKTLKTKYPSALWARRINFGGLLYPNEQKSAIFQGIGIEPEKESEVCSNIKNCIVSGQYFSGNDTHEAIISKELAENIGIGLNAKIMLVGNDRNDFFNMIQLKVVGYIESMLPGVSKSIVYVPLQAAQEFLDMGGEYSELAGRTANLKESKLVVKDIKEILTKDNSMNYEVHSWNEIMPFFENIIELQKIISNVVIIIFFLMVTVAIVNTMLMTIFERINEIGMMRAMGMKKKSVLKLFLTESLLIGAFGGIVGIVVSAIILIILNIVGIKFYPPGTNLSTIIHPGLNIFDVIEIFSFALISSVVASFYPSKFGASLNPLTAIRNE